MVDHEISNALISARVLTCLPRGFPKILPALTAVNNQQRDTGGESQV
jgi:hypothetical protein